MRWPGVLLAATFCAALAAVPAAAAEPVRPDRVVVIALPGVTWEVLIRADTPELDAIASGGAVAAMSVRSAQRGTSPVRGYLTLGAGSRAFAARSAAPPRDEMRGHVAMPAGEPYETGTARDAVLRRTGPHRDGEIVHPHVPYLQAQDRRRLFDTRIGALGEALARTGVRRAVVTAADLAPTPRTPAHVRRAAVLGLVDAQGVVDAGTVSGLVRPDPDAPFGVSTDPDAFERAVRGALDAAQVVLIDPGETQRADEFAFQATQQLSVAARIAALERADKLVGLVSRLVGPRDVLLILAPSTPLAEPLDRLTPVIARGPGMQHGWLTSPATRRDGLVVLTDVAPTVLAWMGAPIPAEIKGTVIRQVASDGGDRFDHLSRLDTESLRREQFIPVLTTLFVVLLAVLAGLAFLAFLTNIRWAAPAARALAYAVLAIPPVTLALRAAGVTRMSVVTITLSLAVLTALVTALAYLVRGPRWAAAVVLLLASSVMLAGDLVTGSELQVSAPLGYSPSVAGRFYGNGNLGFAIFFAATILGLTGLADLLGHRRAPWWMGAGLAFAVIVDGLPPFGADLGGVLAGTPAVTIAFLLARGRRIRWRTVVLLASAAAAVAAVALVLDAQRAPENQTHLGRFATTAMAGGVPAVWTVVRRKATENLGLWNRTAWIWTIPVAVSALGLLLWRPRGVLDDVLPKHPILRAGLAGCLLSGVLGYLANDSGIIITGMTLVHVVPFFLLIGLQTRADAEVRA